MFDTTQSRDAEFGVRLQDEPEALRAWELGDEVVDDAPPGTVPSFANCDPSGWLALELDTGTADPAVLSDEDLIDAIVGFDRIS
jgi:hypothetical protein